MDLPASEDNSFVTNIYFWCDIEADDVTVAVEKADKRCTWKAYC